jgi:hypothetical protein
MEAGGRHVGYSELVICDGAVELVSLCKLLYNSDYINYAATS